MQVNRVFSVAELATYIDCAAKYRFAYEEAVPGRLPWRRRVENAVRNTLCAAVADKSMTIEGAHDKVRSEVEVELCGSDRRLHPVSGDPVDVAVMAVSEWFRFHQNRTALEPGAAILSVLESGGESISVASNCDWFDGDRPRMYLLALGRVPSKTGLALDPAYGLRALASNCPLVWMVEGYSAGLCRQAVRPVRVRPSMFHLRRVALWAAKRIVMGDFDRHAHPSLRDTCIDCQFIDECGRFPRPKGKKRG